MESIFSLPYSEFETMQQIQRYLTPKKGYSAAVPMSRQQKGFDFLIYNSQSKRTLSVQVKSSRSYVHTNPISAAKKNQHLYTFWFNNFVKNYAHGLADIYILFGLYPVYDPSRNIKTRKKFWKSLVLVFTDDEIEAMLKQIKTKKTGKPDRFFYIGFTSMDNVGCTRGFTTPADLAPYVLEKRASFLENLLK